MRDVGQELMQAAKAAGIPAYRGGWTAVAQGDRPPKTYLVFTVSSQPGNSCDDAVAYTQHRAYISVFGSGDLVNVLERFLKKLNDAWLLVSQGDQYDEQTTSNILAATLYREVD